MARMVFRSTLDTAMELAKMAARGEGGSAEVSVRDFDKEHASGAFAIRPFKSRTQPHVCIAAGHEKVVVPLR